MHMIMALHHGHSLCVFTCRQFEHVPARDYHNRGLVWDAYIDGHIRVRWPDHPSPGNGDVSYSYFR